MTSPAWETAGAARSLRFKEITTFPFQANLYNADEPGVGHGSKVIRVFSAGEHTTARYGDHVEMYVEGSGEPSGPERADFTFSRSVFKVNFPSASAGEGEINTGQLAFRQSNGDACMLLGNGVIHNGFGAFSEANVYSIDPDTFALIHGVNMQDAVVNDRDGEYYGAQRKKVLGAGGSAFYGGSTEGAKWTYGLDLSSEGVTQFRQRESDAATLHYKFGDAADCTRTIQDGGLKLFNEGTGELYNDLMCRPESYTPTLVSDVGTVDSTIHNCTYIKQGKRIEVFFDVTINGWTGTPGSLRLGTPGNTRAGTCFGEAGANISTGSTLALLLVPSTNFIQIRDRDGLFPVVATHRISGTFTYLTD